MPYLLSSFHEIYDSRSVALLIKNWEISPASSSELNVWKSVINFKETKASSETKVKNFYGLFNHHKTHMKHFVPLSKSKEKDEEKSIWKENEKFTFRYTEIVKSRETRKNVHWKESEKTTSRIYKFKIFIRRFSLSFATIELRKWLRGEWRKINGLKTVKKSEWAMTWSSCSRDL